MACCNNSSPELADQAKKSKDIDHLLREEEKRTRNEVKLLLLGAGESGKSTIAKQMKIIHLNGFTEDERVSTKSIIYHNVVSSMKLLLTAAQELGITISPEHQPAAEKVLQDEYFSGPLPADLSRCIKALWGDKALKQTVEKASDYNVIDSAPYFFDAIDRLSSPDYIPDEQDILRARSKTTGVKETQFDVEGFRFRLVDVGGQRSERRKWAQCFEDVTAVIFCVAMSEYDMHLAEDGTTNRMHESLNIFKDICNSKWFASTALILFLNKRDLFADKIKRVDLNVCFPDYKGGNDYESSSVFVREQFVAMNENPKKLIYTHFTCATDTNNITVVFRAVKDIVLRQGLQSMGIIQ